MRFLVCQRRSEKPVDAREDGIDVFESDFLLIGVNVHVHIFRRHHDIQHVYRIAPFHQHSAVRLAGGDGNRIVAYDPAVYDCRLVIPIVLAESRLADISAYFHIIEKLLVIYEIIPDVFTVYGIYRVVKSARRGKNLFVIRRIRK